MSEPGNTSYAIAPYQRIPPSPQAASGVHYCIIPQESWHGPNASQHSSYDSSTVVFLTQDGSDISLAQAANRRSAMWNLVVNSAAPWVPQDDPQYSDMSTKVSLRIHFVGYPQGYTRQIMAVRSTRFTPPISLRDMIRKIAEETRAYLMMYNENGRAELHLNGHVYAMEEIFLLGITRISKGSWQPVYYIVPHYP
ncbi:hypothetical protein FKP32DRAFT_1594624 [Trametes sanguinea]|nr:hypothetical protein FKP32DRAFT_1594624 [Trametes sanguinea]